MDGVVLWLILMRKSHSTGTVLQEADAAKLHRRLRKFPAFSLLLTYSTITAFMIAVFTLTKVLGNQITNHQKN
jgi:hypothetical protein